MTILWIPQKLVELVNLTLREIRAKVVTERETSQEFEITSRLKQDDTFSATLFNLSLNIAIGNFDLKGHILQRMIQLEAYVGDVVLVARIVNTLNNGLAAWFLENRSDRKKDKTKYLKVSLEKRRRRIEVIEIGYYKFQGVLGFTLGPISTMQIRWQMK